jgi:outer membrane protein OmpA-like peptidoglycan-associated protein
MKPISLFSPVLLSLALAAPATGIAAITSSYVAGGIGREDLQRMHAMAGEYPLHIRFSEGKRGAFIADVDVSIQDGRGRQVLSLADTGPLLYVRLPRGRYEVTALHNGVQQTRRVHLSQGHARSLSFHWQEPSLSRRGLSLQEAQSAYAKAAGDPQVRRHGSAALQAARVLLRRAEHVRHHEGDLEKTRYLSSLVLQQVDLAWAQAHGALAAQQITGGHQAGRAMTLQNERRHAAHQAAERADIAALELPDAHADADRLARQLDEFSAKKSAHGLILTLRDVLFEVDSAQLKPGALSDLEPLIGFLQKHPDYRVVIDGYTDSVGTRRYNERLSQDRAMTVADDMIAKGVPPDHIQALGFGEDYPVASNRTAAGRQQNRRVELLVLPKGRL